MTSPCHPERSEGSGSRGSEILSEAKDDRAVLAAAPWPTRAHMRLRLMRIGHPRGDAPTHSVPGLLMGHNFLWPNSTGTFQIPCLYYSRECFVSMFIGGKIVEGNFCGFVIVFSLKRLLEMEHNYW